MLLKAIRKTRQEKNDAGRFAVCRFFGISALMSMR
jgi:hypothetical protein